MTVFATILFAHCIQGLSFLASAWGQSFSSETLGVVVGVGYAGMIASTNEYTLEILPLRQCYFSSLLQNSPPLVPVLGPLVYGPTDGC